MQSSKKDTLLQYFNTKKKIFIITDAHVTTELGAILAQGCNQNSAKAVVIASRTTSYKEWRHPQLDLEVTTIDFAFRQFWNYLVGVNSNKLCS